MGFPFARATNGYTELQLGGIDGIDDLVPSFERSERPVIRYPSGRPASEARGAAAQKAFASLPTDRQELSIQCEYTGKGSIAVRLSTAGEYAYVFLDDTQSGAYLATAAIQDQAALFQAVVSYLTERTWFVNSDPRFPDYFGMTPPLDDLLGLVLEKFGASVEVTV